MRRVSVILLVFLLFGCRTAKTAKTAIRPTANIAPAGLAITNLTVANGLVTLSWQQGFTQPPYNVLTSTNPNGPWTVAASPVSNNAVTLPMKYASCFFSVVQPPTNTITILDDNRFGSATTDVYWAGAWITTTTFTSNDCAVAEGCITTGTHKLLRFPVTVWNPSAATYWKGPVGPYYFYDDCHHHFHLTNFSRFSLLGDGVEIVGTKMGWCVRNFGRLLDLGWNTNPPPESCISPALMPGWGDLYSTQSCMWLDITGLADGVYSMVIELDPTRAYGFYSKSDHLIKITGTNVAHYP